MDALVINSISKTFHNHQVLEDISLNIRPGEIFSLLGVNGIGKTTLIKILLNLTRTDHGEVYLFGQDNRNYKSRKNIAFLPEKFEPSGFLKGIEFLKITMRYFAKDLDYNEVDKYCQAFAMPEAILEKRISKYSKGTAQKLGLMATLLSNAPLIILDEPMSGLDPKARIFVKQQLINYNKQGNTIFFTSHIMADVEELCNRIAILHNSKLQFIGSPQELIAQEETTSLEKAFLKVTGNLV